MIKVFLAGEGPNELGSRNGHVAYQTDERPGVLQSLLRCVRKDGWEVVGSINWVNIRKLRVNAPGEGDARNVSAAILKAKEAGADALAFTRDRDRVAEREAQIERAIREAEEDTSLKVAGGVAIETIESWLIALTGAARSESIRHPENEMARLGLGLKDTDDYVAHVERHGIGQVPPGLSSLRLWIERAERALAPKAPPPAP